MRILTQNKSRIVELPAEVWATRCGDIGIICSTSRFPLLGEYVSEKRACEVLTEMFNCYKNNESCYTMPEK